MASKGYDEMPSAFLDNRGVIRVSGGDARTFLQGLVTCDMERVAPGHAAYGALLTPQGKIIADFLLSQAEGAWFLDCPLSLAGDLARRLKFYKLRAKIDVDDLSATQGVAAIWGAPAEGERDARHPDMGARIIGERARLAASHPLSRAAYDAHRIALGVPEGGLDFVYGDAFPHEANMDLLNGVDFKKGCYIGQEVVSRVEHRGTARKRIARVTFESAPSTGSVIKTGDLEIGTLGSVAENHGLAMVRVDRAKEAMDAGVAITIEGRPTALALPVGRG